MTDFFAQLKQTGLSEILFNLFYFLILSTIILTLTWLIRRTLRRRISDNNQRYRMRKMITLVGYGLVVLLAIVTFAGRAEYFTLAVGFISAGIAFALQEVILSFAGWISIYSTGVYKPGDRIEINGVKGDVIDIGITKTTLMEMGQWVKSDNYNGRVVQVSNGFVFKVPVFNYSSSFPFVWDEIDLPIRYGSSVQKTQQILREIAARNLDTYATFVKQNWKEMVRKYLIEDAIVEPQIFVNLTDNWMEFTLRYVVDYKKRTVTKTTVFREIMEAIEQAGGEVQLASATFEITTLPDIHLRSSVKKN